MSANVYKSKVAAVVLAAGASKRMLAIKQLLPWKETTLLGHVLSQLEQSDATDVFLVLGAHETEILKEVNTDNIKLIHNDDWALGMGSSISKTINFLEENQYAYDGILVAVADQPLIDIEHYNKLINSCINSKRIIASYYNNDLGVPVVLGAEYFAELKSLQEDVGAKSIIKKHLEHLIRMDAAYGAIDLDTKERYERFYSTHGK